MAWTNRICSLVAGLIFVCSPVFAQTDGDRIRASVKDGQTVKVTDDQGQQLQGRISAMTVDGLTVTAGGKLTDVPYRQIVRIDHPNDTLKNGALIGLAVGAALAVAAAATAEQPEGCETGGAFFCGETTTGEVIVGVALLAGLGTAVGVGIDALIHRNPEIYRRGGARVLLSPVLGPGVGAALVAVRW